MRRQAGLALLSALLMVALCASLSALLLYYQHTFMRQVAWARAHDRVAYAVNQAKSWAMTVLKQTDNLRKINDWQYHNGEIKATAHLYALGGRLNISALDRDAPERMRRLVSALGLAIDQDRLDQLVAATRAYQQPKDPNDGEYAQRQPSYRSAGQPMRDLSEWRLVAGMNDTLYRSLVDRHPPVFIAIPDQAPWRLNVNWAPAVLWQALGVSADKAQAVVACRQGHYFESLALFMASCGQGVKAFQSQLTVENPYYLLDVALTQSGLQQHSRVLFRVTRNTAGATVVIIWQEQMSD